MAPVHLGRVYYASEPHALRQAKVRGYEGRGRLELGPQGLSLVAGRASRRLVMVRSLTLRRQAIPWLNLGIVLGGLFIVSVLAVRSLGGEAWAMAPIWGSALIGMGLGLAFWSAWWWVRVEYMDDAANAGVVWLARRGLRGYGRGGRRLLESLQEHLTPAAPGPLRMDPYSAAREP